jgi:hypothetical protein
MINLVRLGNKTTSHNFASLEIQKATMKLNTTACILLGAVPGSSRIDVAVDGTGNGAEFFLAIIQPDPNNPDSLKEGRSFSKACSFNSSSIRSGLEVFGVKTFEISKDFIESDGLKWHKLVPRKDVVSAISDEDVEEEVESEQY